MNNKQRRNRDIFLFVATKLKEKVGGQTKYRYKAILKMAEERFYLAPDTIADIHRAYTPDPAQLSILDAAQDEAGQ